MTGISIEQVQSERLVCEYCGRERDLESGTTSFEQTVIRCQDATVCQSVVRPAESSRPGSASDSVVHNRSNDGARPAGGLRGVLRNVVLLGRALF